MRITGISVMLVSFLSIPAVFGSVIGIGLDWRKQVFVQEYWIDGAPHYAIANQSQQPVTITVHARQGEAQLAGPWEIKAKGVFVTGVSELLGKDLVVFKLADGSALGLLRAPVAPAKVIKAGRVTYDGLNGSGGRHETMWIEQKDTTFPSGAMIELKLVATKGGVLKLPKKVKDEAPITQLPLVEAACTTLPIQVKGDNVEIDLSHPLKEQAHHVITLRFQAPEVTTATMFMISGWHASSRQSGHGVTRGVIVAPTTKPKSK